MQFVIGAYAAISLIVFLALLFFCVLGGKDEDLWKPFAYSLTWPVVLPIAFIIKKWRKNESANTNFSNYILFMLNNSFHNM